MLQFIRAPNFWYVYVRRYQQFCTLMADSLRELRTAVREWECWLAQKVVKVKLGQIHLNEVFVVPRVLQSLGYRFACSYMQKKNKQKKQYCALYLDISCLISSPVETICRKNQSFINWKNMKNVSLCSPVFLCTRHTDKLRREVIPPMKIIKR